MRIHLAVVTALGVVGCATTKPLPNTQTPGASIKSPPKQQAAPYSHHPTEGETGFIRNPYAPQRGMIDVRGLRAGTEMKDPYTGRTFTLKQDYSCIEKPVSERKYQELKPMVGHPGFYYVPDQSMGYLDLRERPAGMLFRSAYSGELYLIPSSHVQQKAE